MKTNKCRKNHKAKKDKCKKLGRPKKVYAMTSDELFEKLKAKFYKKLTAEEKQNSKNP